MTRVFRCVILAIGIAAPGAAAAQDDHTMTLFRTTWEESVDSAVGAYRQLPDDVRSAALLVSVADQLLWTGKTAEAGELLSLAAREYPRNASVRFQQGRAGLLQGQAEAALDRFRSALALLEADASLTGDERRSLSGRLENRIRFLERAAVLSEATGVYRTSAGTQYVFRYDPYLITFPTLVEAATGTVRVLYPDSAGALFWRDANGDQAGIVTFRPADGGLDLVIDLAGGPVVAHGIGVTSEAVRIAAGPASIDATLFRPASAGSHPAIVLTHGAGLSSRYNLAIEALSFAAAGVAALVYDKPGLGKSTGGNWLLLSIPEQAGYVIAAVDALERDPAIDLVGVWGFSQGGWVAPLSAARSASVAFAILASGAAVSPQEQSMQSMILQMRADSAAEGDVAAATAHAREVWSLVNQGARLEAFADLGRRLEDVGWGQNVPTMRMQFEIDWWRSNEVDAGAILRRIAVPVLAMFGEKDTAVPPADNVPIMAAHLTRALAADYTIAIIPDADHEFRVAGGYSPLYFPTMINWITARFATTAR